MQKYFEPASALEYIEHHIPEDCSQSDKTGRKQLLVTGHLKKRGIL